MITTQKAQILHDMMQKASRQRPRRTLHKYFKSMLEQEEEFFYLVHLLQVGSSEPLMSAGSQFFHARQQTIVLWNERTDVSSGRTGQR